MITIDPGRIKTVHRFVEIFSTMSDSINRRVFMHGLQDLAGLLAVLTNEITPFADIGTVRRFW
jgi:hypothetical protein